MPSPCRSGTTATNGGGFVRIGRDVVDWRHCLPDLIVMPRHISNQTAPDERHERERDATPVEPRGPMTSASTEPITPARPKSPAHGIKVSNEKRKCPPPARQPIGPNANSTRAVPANANASSGMYC